MRLLQYTYSKWIAQLIFTLLASTMWVTPSLAAPSHPPAVNPLATPELPQSTLLAWAERAVINTFSFDFKDYKDRQKSAAGNFTPQAWKEYNRALVESGNITAVKERKLRLTATVAGEVKVLDQGVIDGHYTWKMELPIKMTYQNTVSNSEVQEQTSTITLIVVKTPPEVNPQGIAISSLIMAPHKE